MTNFISRFKKSSFNTPNVNFVSYQGQQIKYNKMGRAYNKNRSHEATFNINQ